MSVNDDARSMIAAQENQKSIDKWVSSGTPDKEPVTVSTPPPVEPPPEPVVPPAPDPAPAPAVVAPAPPPAAPPAPVEDATPPPAESDVFKLKVGDKEIDVPIDAQFPVVRDGQTEWLPVKDYQADLQRHRDSTAKWEEAAKMRKEAEELTAAERAKIAKERQEFVVNQKLLERREKFMKETREGLLAAASDPQKLETMLKRMEAAGGDAEFKQLLDDAEQGRWQQIADDTRAEEGMKQAQIDAAKQIYGWVDELSQDPRFAGVVDPQRAVDIYRGALQREATSISRDAVEQVFLAERSVIDKVAENKSSKMEAQLEQMQKELAALRGNAGTQHAIDRAKTPNVAPSGGTPPAVAPSTPNGKRFTSDELDARTKRWVDAGR